MSSPRRRTGYATGAVLSAAVGSLAVCHLLAPAWSREAGLDVWNLWAEQQDLEQVTAAKEVLEQDLDRLLRQVAANEWLVGEAVAGRVELGAAADTLAEINAGRPGYQFALRQAHAAATTDRQVFARQVIAMAARQPAPTAVLDRLEREYREMAP
jgi:hypothetical protein